MTPCRGLGSGLSFEDAAKADAVKTLDLDWVCQEVEWLRQQLDGEATDSKGEACASGDSSSARTEERAKRFLSEVVLCHNDLLSGNVLHADGWDRVQVGKGIAATLL